MEQALDFENVREQVTLIGEIVEMHDGITKKIAEARFNFEMIKKNPVRGVGTDQRTGRQVETTPADMAGNIAFLDTERSDIAQILFDITGAQTMDSVRQTYLNLLSAYQRAGGLRELYKLVQLGFRKAIDEAAQSEFIVNPSEFEPLIEQSMLNLSAVVASLPTFSLTNVEVPRIERIKLRSAE